jgi:hypothetical protein
LISDAGAGWSDASAAKGRIVHDPSEPVAGSVLPQFDLKQGHPFLGEQ